MLGGTYLAVLMLGWPMLALCLLGLIDTLIDLRARIARKRGPPATFMRSRQPTTTEVQIEE